VKSLIWVILAAGKRVNKSFRHPAFFVVDSNPSPALPITYDKSLRERCLLQSAKRASRIPLMEWEPASSASPTSRAGSFATTHWSVVQAAVASGSPNAEAALEALCRAYWPAIYAHIRRLGNGPEEARDLAQGFFCRLLEKNWLEEANRERGRFRTFLLAALKHFMANEWRRAQAQKRGGGRILISLDALSSEEGHSWEPADARTPDQLFDYRWALAVLEQATARLEEECRLGGKVRQFAVLKSFLGGGAEGVTYAGAAAELGTTEAAAKMAATRLRRRFRTLLRTVIADTVGSEGEVEDELRHLVKVLTNPGS
jgi:RNA polymerase sigma-70 factor (ECF subfamily)